MGCWVEQACIGQRLGVLATADLVLLVGFARRVKPNLRLAGLFLVLLRLLGGAAHGGRRSHGLLVSVLIDGALDFEDSKAESQPTDLVE